MSESVIFIDRYGRTCEVDEQQVKEYCKDMRHTIKPLVWVRHDATCTTQAKTPFGIFSIDDRGTAKFMIGSNFPEWSMGCENVDSAKINVWIYWVDRLSEVLDATY